MSHLIRKNFSVVSATIKDGDKVQDDRVVEENQRIYEFRQLSCEDVCTLVQKSAKKTYTFDPRPTSMVVACLPRGTSSSYFLYTKFVLSITSFSIY